MSKENRALLESTLFNLSNDKGSEKEMYSQLAIMSDADLENLINDILADL